VLRPEDQKSSRKTEDNGKARRDMASGAIFVIVKGRLNFDFRPPLCGVFVFTSGSN